MAMKCRLCGKGPNEIRGYLKRVNELGVEGVWECRPSCDADLSQEERVIAAIEGDGCNHPQIVLGPPRRCALCGALLKAGGFNG